MGMKSRIYKWGLPVLSPLLTRTVSGLRQNGRIWIVPRQGQTGMMGVYYCVSAARCQSLVHIPTTAGPAVHDVGKSAPRHACSELQPIRFRCGCFLLGRHGRVVFLP
jgi:hypothetical protein